VRLKTDIAKQDLPADGELILEATGRAPALRFDQPGTVTMALGDLQLQMTPRKADGSLTELGTFTAPCTLDPGQETTLHSFEVTGEAATPETPVGEGSTSPLKQVYNCFFPIIEHQDVSVEISTALPGSVQEGTFTPQIDIKALSNAGVKATNGLRLTGARSIEGTARATSLLKSP